MRIFPSPLPVVSVASRRASSSCIHACLLRPAERTAFKAASLTACYGRGPWPSSCIQYKTHLVHFSCPHSDHLARTSSLPLSAEAIHSSITGSSVAYLLICITHLHRSTAFILFLPSSSHHILGLTPHLSASTWPRASLRPHPPSWIWNTTISTKLLLPRLCTNILATCGYSHRRRQRLHPLLATSPRVVHISKAPANMRTNKMGGMTATAFAGILIQLATTVTTVHAFPQIAPGVSSGEGQISGPASTPE